jgi:two-component system chemotaxis response regulator CheB
MQALAAGAVSIISRPKFGLKGFLEDATNDIVAAIRAAARTNAVALARDSRSPPPIGGERRLPTLQPDRRATAPTPSSPPAYDGGCRRPTR